MTSNPPTSSTITKGTNTAPSQLPSPSQSHVPSSASLDSQRRSGTLGNNAVTRGNSVINARNNQSLKKQHKVSRRPKLGGEDASAESVSRSRLGLKKANGQD